MSNNLASIFVGLGYDLSALEKGAPEAYRLINQQTEGMSAEMKRSAREGAESWRLIDEALGIHVSRPLTRLLTQEFPAFAQGLQSLLGVGVVGALAVAGLEFFDKIAKAVEHAQKAQEEFAKATEKTKTVFEDALQSYEKGDKLRSLSGLDLELFKIDTASIDQARKHVDELTAAFEEMVKKEEEASGFFTKIGAWIADQAHTLYNTPTHLAAEELGKQFGEFKRRFDELSKVDATKNTRDGAKYLNDQLATAQILLAEMSSHKMTDIGTFARNQLPTKQTGQYGYSEEEITQEQRFVDMLKEQQELQGKEDQQRRGLEAAARSAAALEAHREEVRELQGDLKNVNNAADDYWKTWIKINEEIEKSAGVDFSTHKSTGDGTLPFSSNRKAPSLEIGPPPGAPTLSDQVELAKVQSDQNEAYKKAGEILEQIESPLQKYQTGIATLATLQGQGRISTQQLAQAQAVLQEQLVHSANRLEEMDRQMEKLLAHSESAGDGARAFFLKWEIESSQNGKFAFDILNEGLKGFEDETAKALTGAKTHWSSFFESIDQMALKFVLNKEIMSLFKMLSDTSFGKSLGLDKLASGGPAAAAAIANTTALTALTSAVVANTTAQMAHLSAPGGDAGGDFGDLTDSGGVQYNASGTNDAPGGLSWVGESGPELMDVPAGSSITPNSSSRTGHEVHVHIDARGGEIGVEEKIARAISTSAPSIILRAVTQASEVQRRSPR